MFISDLNILETVEVSAVIGGTGIILPPPPKPNTYTFTKTVTATNTGTSTITNTATVTDTLTKNATYTVTSTVTGNSGSIAFDNEAIGANSNTQTALSQLVVAGQSSNQSGLIVASAG